MGCKLSFIFESGKCGFSETWYTDETDPKISTQFGNATLLKFMGLRGNGVILRAIRSSDLSTPRLSYLRIVNLTTAILGGNTTETNDLPQAAILSYVTVVGGRRRPLLTRGLADSYVAYDNSGIRIFSGQFLSQFAQYVNGLKIMQLRIRTLDKADGGNPERQVIGLAPAGTSSNSTAVTFAGADIADGSRVIFHGLSRQLFPGFTGPLPIARVNATSFVVPVKWNFPGTSYAPVQTTVRAAFYSLGQIDTIIPEDFRSKKVGRPSLLSRGRRAALKYRSQ